MPPLTHSIHPQDLETICAVCNLKYYRDLALTAYYREYKLHQDEQLAFTKAMEVVQQLNKG